MNTLLKLSSLALAPLWITQVTEAHAADTKQEPVITLQLNKADTTQNGCRVSLVVRNHLQEEVTQLALDLVLFDNAGEIADFLSMKTGRLPSGKTRVRQYDLPSGDCAAISSVLVNNVTQCEGTANVSPARCLDALKVSSRAAIELTL
ncbi:hypothetical protein GCM10007094_38720 [Pseudovibrio japonicus]|uniref:Tat pathway signal sequence domain protein n=1 Tax=Pseudovibrio japonicus TaxID=366534 RepID=A0ABQ3ENT5_9HYPH|nr:hypothetical protein [Pseudovibrio japonicus]GHB45552.1 hypothetical protein GCM10007094_38720 [Pseudovibrio japonicus]